MNQKTFTRVAGLIFTLIAVLHAVRLFRGWEAVIAGWSVPHVVSWAAVVVFGWLAVTAFRLK